MNSASVFDRINGQLGASLPPLATTSQPALVRGNRPCPFMLSRQRFAASAAPRSQLPSSASSLDDLMVGGPSVANVSASTPVLISGEIRGISRALRSGRGRIGGAGIFVLGTKSLRKPTTLCLRGRVADVPSARRTILEAGTVAFTSIMIMQPEQCADCSAIIATSLLVCSETVSARLSRRRTISGGRRPGVNGAPTMPHEPISAPVDHQTVEEFRIVVGFEMYRVSDLGRVQSLHSGQWRDMKPSAGHKGHLAVALSKGGKQYSRYVHRLVLEEFVGPCPEGMEACHDPDRDPANCALSNLRWDTRKANIADAVRHGTARLMYPGESNPAAVLTRQKVEEIIRRRAAGEPIESLAGAYGVVNRTIQAILYGRSWPDVPRPEGLVRRRKAKI
jgi:hypothetical protein